MKEHKESWAQAINLLLQVNMIICHKTIKHLEIPNTLQIISIEEHELQMDAELALWALYEVTQMITYPQGSSSCYELYKMSEWPQA